MRRSSWRARALSPRRTSSGVYPRGGTARAIFPCCTACTGTALATSTPCDRTLGRRRWRRRLRGQRAAPVPSPSFATPSRRSTSVRSCTRRRGRSTARGSRSRPRERTGRVRMDRRGRRRRRRQRTPRKWTATTATTRARAMMTTPVTTFRRWAAISPSWSPPRSASRGSTRVKTRGRGRRTSPIGCGGSPRSSAPPTRSNPRTRRGWRRCWATRGACPSPRCLQRSAPRGTKRGERRGRERLRRKAPGRNSPTR
mmetsp:Transcript_11697/g.50439  ORF Transcript_11697/g.50439 Transcript_11697/m.50439 type:complete len:255 (-) Transcript_11697:1164-1928(-)